jgi:NAD(P)H-flavin reductase/ferredoxin
MPLIHFDGAALDCADGETVLECMERNGVDIASSCRSGVCQSCALRCVEGTIPSSAQAGLKPALQQQGFFLSCSWSPTEDIRVVRVDDAGQRVSAVVQEVAPLGGVILRVRLTATAPFAYAPGQFANLVRPGGVVRSYSLASLPGVDDFLEFHVAEMPNGRMSGWLANDAAPGDSIDLLGPLGHCYYIPEPAPRPMLLAGTGTGLAPLYGILRDALARGHSAPVHLVHGSVKASGLYLVDELRRLARDHENVTYTPCVLDGEGAGADVTVGAIDALILGSRPNYKGWRAYLCGHPDIVRTLQRKLFLHGAALSDIHADAFLPSADKALRS